METPSARLISWHNATSTDNDFPVNFDEEASHPVFAYTCGGSPYQNANDNSESPIVTGSAQAYSPNNDVFYFGDQNYTMLRAYLPDVMQPWGDNLPIRMYTHVANLDNAFAISPVNPAPETDMNDNNFNAQFVVGNGLNTNYPFSDAGTVGHELAHIFTAYAANLIYANQSGGINEAYSDITGKAYEDYVFRQYPWYGETWGGGLSIVLPTVEDKNSEYRHMNNPPLDGNSIDNLSKYVQGMNVHFSSGVFNKAFFLMVDGHGIDVVQGFKYFSYANINYWTPGTNFEHASCGVIEAAIDMQQSEAVEGIKSSFEEVGVHCKVGFKQLKTPL